MNRVIINYRNITTEIIEAIKDQYPYGYSDNDMLIFRNAKNEIVKTLEVTLNDTDYLIKMSKQLAIHLDNFGDDIEEINLEDSQLAGFE